MENFGADSLAQHNTTQFYGILGRNSECFINGGGTNNKAAKKHPDYNFLEFQ